MAVYVFAGSKSLPLDWQPYGVCESNRDKFGGNYLSMRMLRIDLACKQVLPMGYSEICFRIARGQKLGGEGNLGITHTESLFAG